MAFDITGMAPGGAERREERVFEQAIARLSSAVAEAVRGRSSWLERVRAGLVAFLGFFDDEPGSGWLLIPPAPRPSDTVAQRGQQRVLGVLTGLLDDGGPLAIGELMLEPQLTSELVAGGVVSVLHTRLREQEAGVPGASDHGALVGLAPALMAFIVRPYLGGAAASAELTGGSPAGTEKTAPAAIEPPVERPSIRVTHRTLVVLHAIAAAPRSSNRRVAQNAGLSDEGQASRLLGRLRKHGLIENAGAGAEHGGPNAWLLTAEGRRMLRLTRGAAPAGRHARGDIADGGCVA